VVPENDVMGPSGLVTVSRASDARIAVLTLNRPQSLKALTTPLLDALDCALDMVAGSDAFAGAILTGAGRAFSAGADLHELGVEPMTMLRRMHALALQLRDFPKIIVASINGPALGGGLEVAMGCTFRMAAADASLGLREIKMNLMPGFGGTQLLPRLVGESRALRILLSEHLSMPPPRYVSASSTPYRMVIPSARPRCSSGNFLHPSRCRST